MKWLDRRIERAVLRLANAETLKVVVQHIDTPTVPCAACKATGRADSALKSSNFSGSADDLLMILMAGQGVCLACRGSGRVRL